MGAGAGASGIAINTPAGRKGAVAVRACHSRVDRNLLDSAAENASQIGI